MLVSKISIITGGILSLFMVGFHTQFYKMFDWKKEFDVISLKNQRIFYTIHMALLLLFLMCGVLSFVYLHELSKTQGLALGFTLTYSLFWLWRTIWQIIYFKPPKTQEAQKMRTMHFILIIVFSLLFAAYLLPVLISVI